MQVAYFQGDLLLIELPPLRGMGMLRGYFIQILSTSLIFPSWCHTAPAVLAENGQFTGINKRLPSHYEWRTRLEESLMNYSSLNTHAQIQTQAEKKTVGGEAERMRQTMEKRKLCIITKVQAKRLSWAAEYWKDEIWKANSWVVRSRSSLSLAISGLTHKRLRSLSAKQIENNWRSPNVVISSALHSLVTRTHSQEGHFTLTQRDGREL